MGNILSSSCLGAFSERNSIKTSGRQEIFSINISYLSKFWYFIPDETTENYSSPVFSKIYVLQNCCIRQSVSVTVNLTSIQIERVYHTSPWSNVKITQTQCDNTQVHCTCYFIKY